jgi:hypothetical protein
VSLIPREIERIEVSSSMDSSVWTAQVDLADPSDQARTARGKAFQVDILGEIFEMFVDSLPLEQPAFGQMSGVVTGQSPVAKYDLPWSKPISKTWKTAVMAKDAVEEVLQQTVDWQVVDWEIPPDKLSFLDASRLDIATTIVQAVGGVLVSNKNGTLRVPYRFPVAVRKWDKQTPSHTFTEVSHLFSSSTTKEARRVVNKISFRSEGGGESLFRVEVDDRKDGLNKGETQFNAGDKVGLLVYKGSSVAIKKKKVSAGTLELAGADVTFDKEEQASFTNSSSVQLSVPVHSNLVITWWGESLGTLALSPDGTTLTAEESGVAVATVKYKAKATPYWLHTPDELGGEDTFPINLWLQGSVKAGATTVQRDGGGRPGPDISDPLLSTLPAILARGRVELDGYEDLQEYTMDVRYRAGVEIGQLVKIVDDSSSDGWIGLVKGLSYTRGRTGVDLRLTLLRYIGE